MDRPRYPGDVLRVTVRGPAVPAIVLGFGETLLFGRAPQPVAPTDDIGG
jgi:hypothetical protein